MGDVTLLVYVCVFGVRESERERGRASGGSLPGKAGQSALMNLQPVPEQLCRDEIALAFLDSELIG